MNKKLAIGGAVVLALAVGFGGGLFLGMKASRMVQADALAHNWVGLAVALAPQRVPYEGKLRDPAAVASLAGGNLDALSISLAYFYDDLSRGEAHQVRAFAPQARAIAAAQQGTGLMHDRAHLRILADCLDAANAAGESVRECASKRGMFGPADGSAPKASGVGSTVSLQRDE